jgi:hypothetical protein
MAQLFLIAISAGAASAFLFTSLASGSPVALLLAQLAPLPILIAGLGWSHWAALLAVGLAASALGTYLGGLFFLGFLFTIGLPAWWLSYLALLARPGTSAEPVEWYPVGRLVVWACLFGTLVTTVGLVKISGLDGDFDTALRSGFERFLRLQAGVTGQDPLKIPGLTDPARFLDMMVLVIPPAAAATSAVTNLLNLWLAGRVVALSGRLRRPWPDLAAFRLPRMAATGLVVAVLGSFLPDLAGMAGRLVAAGLAVAHMLLGLAVMHAVTGALSNRSLVLVAAYALMAIFQWPVLLMLVLGLSDTVIDWRSRLTVKNRPNV